MTSVSINREASDKTKGFRLQKVRAIELMLKSINKDTDSVFYTAIENVEDVSHWHVEDNSQKKITMEKIKITLQMGSSQYTALP